MNLTKKEKQKIKSKLQFGDIAKIASMIGRSRMTVTRWFNDESNSDEISDAIDTLLKKRVKSLENLRKSIG